MDKEKRKIFKMVRKLFEEKGIETDNIEELEEIEKKKEKKKTHQIEKITDLKDMLSKTKQKFGDKAFVRYKKDKQGEIGEITYNEFIDDINRTRNELNKSRLKKQENSSN